MLGMHGPQADQLDEHGAVACCTRGSWMHTWFPRDHAKRCSALHGAIGRLSACEQPRITLRCIRATAMYGTLRADVEIQLGETGNCSSRSRRSTWRSRTR